jgi:hypothetical protein
MALYRPTPLGSRKSIKMGMDFSALMCYRGPMDNDFFSAIDQLESSPHHPKLEAVVNFGQDQDFAFAAETETNATWRIDWQTQLLSRPKLPDLAYYLNLPSGFDLTFGHGAILIYHPLRWIFFITDEQWQRLMLNATSFLCQLFNAADCIITSDFNPAITSFLDGRNFADSLLTSEPHEGEVETLDDLYEEWEDDSDLALKPAGNGLEGQIVTWPKSKPLPEGWQRATIWDSKGYWRLPLEGNRDAN